MKHNKYQLSIAVIASMFLVACSGAANDKNNDTLTKVETIAVPAEKIEIERFDRAVAAYPTASAESRDSLIVRYAPIVDVMRVISGGGSDDEVMAALAASAASKVFQPDVERLLPDLSSASAALGSLKAAMARTLPEVKFPARVFGYVTPYSQSVVIADSVVLLGLNHFLGSDYEGYGSFDEYVRRMKTPSRIPYQVAEALIRSGYPYDEADGQTVLSRLLYEGAVVTAVKDVVAGSSAADAMGYTGEEMKWLTDNESRIWQKMSGEEMLFSIDPVIAHRLTNPAPSTPLINPRAPGRAGRYIGYRIVESYLKSHPDIALQTLLTPGFYRSGTTLKDSGYRP